MPYSFDILISGVSKEQAGPLRRPLVWRDFADDGRLQPAALTNDEVEQAWGQGYYSPCGLHAP